MTWEGITWRIAEDGGTLWVLAPTRDMVETHRPALTRLALAVASHGGLDNVTTELAAGRPLRARAEGAKPKASNKRLALNAVTESVRDAYAAGATAQDVRLAVLSALGLDADVA